MSKAPIGVFNDLRSMTKSLLLLLLLPFALSAAPTASVPFYLGGWEMVLGKQFETIIDRKSDESAIEFSAFWVKYSPEMLGAEATAFLKRSNENGDFSIIDPDQYEMSVTAIRMERLRLAPLSDSWYVIVELSAWGKQQLSGVPLWFQLVMIPGCGFKTPTLVRQPLTPEGNEPKEG